MPTNALEVFIVGALVQLVQDLAGLPNNVLG
jgi:hypothetical protein